MHHKGYLAQRKASHHLYLIQSGKACKINWIKNTIDEEWRKAQLPE